jgi:hypothetical protein
VPLDITILHINENNKYIKYLYYSFIVIFSLEKELLRKLKGLKIKISV